MAAVDMTGELCEAYPMVGGDGPNSYVNNSSYQRGGIDSAKELINKAIAENLALNIMVSSKTFHIADLGCSIGPNTFRSVQNIIEAVQFKYRSQRSQTPEFQVYFSDHAQNDFNMLFKSLPQDTQYYSAGVPGSFYGRLFPSASIQIFHSAFALPWLSEVPKAIVEKTGPAWNKGRIYYTDASDEVVNAYEAQHTKDMESFLSARAQEIVHGGLMVLIISVRPDGTPHSHTRPNVNFQILGSCFMELIRKGIVEEEKVDAFNIPTYFMSPKELRTAVERNGCFNVESTGYLPHFSLGIASERALILASHIRASLEGLIKQRFGDEILDELFDLFRQKLEEQYLVVKSAKEEFLFVALRRK